jgi:hypothetical protein
MKILRLYYIMNEPENRHGDGKNDPKSPCSNNQDFHHYPPCLMKWVHTECILL